MTLCWLASLADLGGDVIVGVRLNVDPRIGAPVASQDPALLHAPERASLLTVVFTMLDVMQEAGIECLGTQGASLIIRPAVPGDAAARPLKRGRPSCPARPARSHEALPTLRRLLPWLG